MNVSTRQPQVFKPVHKVRFVTAASLFDGHDASINIMRRILQASGCEVIHLGHNRSVEEIVNCAIAEDAHGIAISSYQGGHVEFFKYMLDLLRERGAGHIKVFGGGGGVIVQAEIKELHDYGVARIFSPEDGQRIGLQGMINEIVAAADTDLAHALPTAVGALTEGDRFARTRALARLITGLEAGTYPAQVGLITPSGANYEPHGGRRANVKVAGAGACNLVLNFAPFLIVETGDYKVRAELMGETLEGSFHVAFDSVASSAS